MRHLQLILTLTSSEGLWYRSLAVSIYRLRWRCRADDLALLRVWRAGNDRRDGRDALASEGVGAHVVNSGLVVLEHMVWHRWRYGRRYRLFARNGGPQTQLELRLCGAEERLVDLGLVGVQDDIRCG